MTARTTARPARTSRLVAGAVLLLLAFALSASGLSAAIAQEEGEAEDIEIGDSTLYVSPATDAIPPTLTNSIPPAAICVVRPELCSEDTEERRNQLRDGIGAVLDESQDTPIQPVPPDSAAVSLFGGHTRYQTAIKFEPPSIPEGHEPMSAVLTLDQGQPSYDLNSPLFRGIFFSFFAALGEGTHDMGNVFERFIEELTREVQESDPVDLSQIIGVEACPLLSPFEAEGAPQASPEEDLPGREEDGSHVPDVDCILGASGVFDEEAETWSFDLGFTLAQWDSGDLDNHGILLRPTGSPNLAFGDPDTSTVAQVVLDLESATMAVTTAEAFDPSDFAGGFDDAGDGGFDAEPVEFEEGGFDDGGGFAAPGDTGDFGDVPLDDPAVAEDPPLDAAPEAEEPALAVDARDARPGPHTPLWVWSVIPLLLGGAWLTGSALLAPAPAAAAAGGGALTKLIARNAAGAPTAL